MLFMANVNKFWHNYYKIKHNIVKAAYALLRNPTQAQGRPVGFLQRVTEELNPGPWRTNPASDRGRGGGGGGLEPGTFGLQDQRPKPLGHAASLYWHNVVISYINQDITFPECSARNRMFKELCLLRLISSSSFVTYVKCMFYQISLQCMHLALTVVPNISPTV